jgi:hypothetical protein
MNVADGTLSRDVPAGLALQPGETVVAVIYPWWAVGIGFYIFTLGLWEFWRRRHYIALTNQRLVYAKGILLVKSSRSVQLSRVQDATYERRLWAGGVAISSAGGALGNLKDVLYRPREARAFVHAVNDAARRDHSSGLGETGGVGTSESVGNALRELAKLRDEGLIDSGEYETKRQELLKRL